MQMQGGGARAGRSIARRRPRPRAAAAASASATLPRPPLPHALSTRLGAVALSLCSALPSLCPPLLSRALLVAASHAPLSPAVATSAAATAAADGAIACLADAMRAAAAASSASALRSRRAASASLASGLLSDAGACDAAVEDARHDASGEAERVVIAAAVAAQRCARPSAAAGLFRASMGEDVFGAAPAHARAMLEEAEAAADNDGDEAAAAAAAAGPGGLDVIAGGSARAMSPPVAASPRDASASSAVSPPHPLPSVAPPVAAFSLRDALSPADVARLDRLGGALRGCVDASRGGSQICAECAEEPPPAHAAAAAAVVHTSPPILPPGVLPIAAAPQPRAAFAAAAPPPFDDASSSSSSHAPACVAVPRVLTAPSDPFRLIGTLCSVDPCSRSVALSFSVAALAASPPNAQLSLSFSICGPAKRAIGGGASSDTHFTLPRLAPPLSSPPPPSAGAAAPPPPRSSATIDIDLSIDGEAPVSIVPLLRIGGDGGATLAGAPLRLPLLSTLVLPLRLSPGAFWGAWGRRGGAGASAPARLVPSPPAAAASAAAAASFLHPSPRFASALDALCSGCDAHPSLARCVRGPSSAAWSGAGWAGPPPSSPWLVLVLDLGGGGDCVVELRGPSAAVVHAVACDPSSWVNELSRGACEAAGDTPQEEAAERAAWGEELEEGDDEEV